MRKNKLYFGKRRARPDNFPHKIHRRRLYARDLDMGVISEGTVDSMPFRLGRMPWFGDIHIGNCRDCGTTLQFDPMAYYQKLKERNEEASDYKLEVLVGGDYADGSGIKCIRLQPPKLMQD